MAFRRAASKDALLLSNLALRSKAYWGYDDKFIEACKEGLTITTEYIAKNPVYLLEQKNEIQGFYCFVVAAEKLDLLFVDSKHIGKGIGKKLWKHLILTAKQLGLSKFTIDSDPNAEDFYKKMGAVRIGEIPSTVFSNRKLPLMQVMLD